jgi:hypothetical protein
MGDNMERRKFIGGTFAATVFTAFGCYPLSGYVKVPDIDHVVIDVDDIKALTEFANHFDIKVSSQLQEAMVKCQGGIDIWNQFDLKVAVADWIHNSTHPVMIDDLFVNVKADCIEFLNQCSI